MIDVKSIIVAEIMPEQKTYVTRLTADAPGAIAVVRLWGPGAVAAADRIFEPKLATRSLAQTPPGRPRLGRFAGDEVVALILPESAGLKNLEVEIQCHGSPLVVQAIISKLAEVGVEEALPAQFQQAHGVKWLERVAMVHVGRATAPKAVLLLWQQHEGALRQGLQAVLNALENKRPDEANALLARLSATASWATRLASGFRVALAGPPNVGKSSLANALAGFERVVVSPEPGTTRDVVDVRLTIGGWPIILTDTAGLRHETADPLERAGISLARQEHARADLVLKLSEATAAVYSDDEMAGLQEPLVVRTKADLVVGSSEMEAGEGLWVSAKTGQGLDELMTAMVSRLIPVEFRQESGPVGAILFDKELSNEIQRVWMSDLEEVKKCLRELLDRE